VNQWADLEEHARGLTQTARFMNKAGWTASVNKMINAFGAPIDKADVETIATYLAQQYGVQP
jgi:hypothetical protein